MRPSPNHTSPLQVTSPAATYRAMRQKDPTLPPATVKTHQWMATYADSDTSMVVSEPYWKAAKAAGQDRGLVFLLAHEASHVRHKDPSRYGAWQQLADRVTNGAGIVGGVGSALIYGTNMARHWRRTPAMGRAMDWVTLPLVAGAGWGVGRLSGWGGASLWVNHRKRQAEFRADRETFDTMRRLGYTSDQAMAGAEEFLGKDTPYCHGLEVLTCTHPRPRQRLDALGDR